MADPDINATKAFLNIAFGTRDWDNEHLQRTPERFLGMLRELTEPVPFVFTTFASDTDEMVIIKDIDFISVCAHHVVPFIGKAHVAYIPNGHIAGLSKFVRCVRSYAKDLNVQEELTQNIADRIDRDLTPAGVAVVMEAEHMCMTIRGVQSAGTKTMTSCMKGVFLDPTKQARSEFLNLIGRNHG